MENWVVFLLVNVVLVIVLGVITNLITPSIKSAYERSIFSSKWRRAQRLLKDYKAVKQHAANTSSLTVFFLGEITFLIAFSAMLIYILLAAVAENLYKDVIPEFVFLPGNITVKAWIYIIGSTLILGFITYEAVWITMTISNVSHFDDYKQQTIKKLLKLGGNPEDLDKEETEG